MSETIPDLVIGSGPTGYAAVLALLAAGRPAAVLDFGSNPAVTVPPRQGIATKPDPRSLRAFSHPRALIADVEEQALPLSSARGGLSLIWGAAVLERSAADSPELAPISSGLADGFDTLAEHVDLAGADDQLSRRFPWKRTTEAVPCSTRYSRIRQRAQETVSAPALIGSPRVALRAGDCTRCGQCLTGCPEGLFFNAENELRRLSHLGDIQFVTGPALTLHQSDHGVVVTTPHGEVHAERIFLAAGPIATPALLQRSRLVPASLTVQDSAVFYLPILNRLRSFGDESDYTAAQLLVTAPQPGPEDFTLAIYESNPDFRTRLARMFRIPERVLPFPQWVSNRINAGIGFLSPENSGRLTLRCTEGRTWVERQAHSRTRTAAVRAARQAARALRIHGLEPIPKSAIVPPPGVGFHSGGALPLGSQFVTWNGELRAAPKIRLIDTTVLPRIWAGSHTYTAMANAVRTVAASQ